MLFIVSLILAGRALSAQPAQLSFRHFTTDDGLPSSQTYFTLEDQDGFLWIGTDNGVARYNGYEFEVFNSAQGLEDGVVFSIQETADGKIWVSTLSGRVYYFENEAFHPYRFNDVLVRLKESRELMFLLDVLSTGELVVKVNYQGIIRVENDGSITWLVKDKLASTFNIYRPENSASPFPRQFRTFISGKWKRSTTKRAKATYLWDGKTFTPFAAGGDGGSVMIKDVKAARHLVLDRMEDGGGLLVVGTRKITHLFPDGSKYEFPLPGDDLTHILPLGENRYFCTALSGLGLLEVTLDYAAQTAKVDTFLRGKSLSMVTEDQKGGLWITSLDDGLFYCPYPRQRVLIAENAGLQTRPTAIALADSTNLFAAYANSEVRLHDTETRLQYRVTESSDGIGGMADDIHYDPVSGNLLVATWFFENALNVKSGGSTKKTFRNKTGVSKLFSAKEFHQIGDTLYWVSPHNFGVINPASGYLATRLKALLPNIDYHGLETFFPFPNGKKYVGTWFGLKELTPDGELVADDLGIDALKGRIERILSLGNGKIAIGTRSSGLVIWSEDAVQVIGEAQKLASNQVRNLHLTEDGTLWVATLQGMSKITENQEGSYQVRSFNIGNGLIDNEVHDFDSWENELWVASTAGIYKFHEPPFDSLSRPPTISAVRVNGESLPLSAELSLAPTQNYLTFEYSNVLFSKGNTVNYRYRINGEAWQTSRERRANFPNLAAGNYLFEVQSENKDGVWSESTSVSFTVAAFFLNTWKPWAIGIILLLGGLTTIFMVRERNRKREQNFLLEINRLEHAALHAQMNPHFVFNCLNSIQNFVLHNHTREAATYLSRFAKLIRKTLNSSLRGQHSLAEEKEMLEGYLELEKLRFKDVFNYEVELDPDLPSRQIFVPPLLIQPFVENAILHGMKDRSEGGLIRVVISGNERRLNVSITDNGIGFDPDAPTSSSSKGMLITTKRFAANAGSKKGRDQLSVNPIVNSRGEVVGTIVALTIIPVAEVSEPASVPL